MTDESEQKTLQDLFRVINDMRGDMNTRFDEAAAERQEMRVSIEEVKGETQAIREVVDTLASQEDFADLDRKISSVSADTQAARQSTRETKAEVSRLRADVKAAGIPVR